MLKRRLICLLIPLQEEQCWREESTTQPQHNSAEREVQRGRTESQMKASAKVEWESEGPERERGGERRGRRKEQARLGAWRVRSGWHKVALDINKYIYIYISLYIYIYKTALKENKGSKEIGQPKHAFGFPCWAISSQKHRRETPWQVYVSET